MMKPRVPRDKPRPGGDERARRRPCRRVIAGAALDVFEESRSRRQPVRDEALLPKLRPSRRARGPGQRLSAAPTWAGLAAACRARSTSRGRYGATQAHCVRRQQGGLPMIAGRLHYRIHLEARQGAGRRLRGRGREARPARRPQVPAATSPGRDAPRALPARGRTASAQPPGICTYDIDQHEDSTSSRWSGLEGETLAERIRKAGRDGHPPRPRHQIADALESAHAKGSSTATSSGQHLRHPARAGEGPRLRPRQDRAARPPRGGGLRGAPAVQPSELTQAGTAMGTVSYMSPSRRRPAHGLADRPLLAGHRALPDGLGRPALPGRDLGRGLDAILNREPTPLAH